MLWCWSHHIVLALPPNYQLQFWVVPVKADTARCSSTDTGFAFEASCDRTQVGSVFLVLNLDTCFLETEDTSLRQGYHIAASLVYLQTALIYWQKQRSILWSDILKDHLLTDTYGHVTKIIIIINLHILKDHFPPCNKTYRTEVHGMTIAYMIRLWLWTLLIDIHLETPLG